LQAFEKLFLRIPAYIVDVNVGGECNFCRYLKIIKGVFIDIWVLILKTWTPLPLSVTEPELKV